MDVTTDGRLLRLTLNRIDRRNALNRDTCELLKNAFEQAEKDPFIGAVLLSGAGPVFCSGLDLDEARDTQAEDLMQSHGAVFTAGLRLKKPLIAAIHGACLGGGVGLAANAHIVLAEENCRFSLPEINFGLWPFTIWKSLEVALGERRAIELALTGRTFSAADAERWGLVHQITTPADLLPAALATARKISEQSPIAIERGLALVHGSREKNPQDAMELALWLRDRTIRGADFHEGVAAWRQRRSPVWPSLARNSDG